MLFGKVIMAEQFKITSFLREVSSRNTTTAAVSSYNTLVVLMIVVVSVASCY